MTKQYNLDWSELAFASKKPLRDLKATFIAAPREISAERFTQLVKKWLPSGNVVLGIAKEEYIDGFEGQTHFRTLRVETIQKVINKVNVSKTPHKIYSFHYFQRELGHILEKVAFNHHLFINGSWHTAFHNLPAYFVLANNHRNYQLISPFIDEQEAKKYTLRLEKEIQKTHSLPVRGNQVSEKEMMKAALLSSTYSFDYTFQTGVVLGKAAKSGFKFLAASYNRVVPFQGYALHYGAAREINFSPPHDVNHYDTVHAEVEMILQAARGEVDLRDTSFFINTLPCPTCARMLSQTDIKEFIYQNDHSEGYAIKILEACGKIVRRLVL